MATSQSLGQLGVKFKELGRGDLRRRLLKDIRVASAPLREAARQSALENLPKAGGLNQLVASSKFSTRTSLSARSARVRIVGANPHAVRSMDRGRLRHKTFGHEPWVTQQIEPGWWTKPMEEGTPQIRAAIVRTVKEISREL